MTDEEVIKSNILIRKFMKVSPMVYGDWNITTQMTNGNYHSSWDWLIPVIKHIREIVNVNLTIDEYGSFKGEQFTLDSYNFSIEDVYEGTVLFIKWYNENIKND